MTKKEQEKRAKLEAKIQKEIQKICENKARNIRPKKWGLLDDNEVELVYWRDYWDDKRVERRMCRIMNKIEKKFGIGVSACADTTEQLNWYYIYEQTGFLTSFSLCCYDTKP